MWLLSSVGHNSMWLCRLLNSKNFLWHSEHSCFIPVWVSMWLRRVLNFKNFLWHSEHSCCFFPVGSACDNADCIVVKTSCGICRAFVRFLLQYVVSIWRCRLHNSEKFLWHSEHSCGFSPVWVSMCCCRLPRRLNIFLQYLHWCVVEVRLRFCTQLVALETVCLSLWPNDLSS